MNIIQKPGPVKHGSRLGPVTKAVYGLLFEAPGVYNSGRLPMNETGDSEVTFIRERGEGFFALVVVLYVSAFFVGSLITDTTTLLPSYQDESQWLIYHAFINQSFSAGYFPLWTPDLFCGMPFLGWSHTAALYPGNLIYGALDFGRGVWVSQWLHSVVYALGLYFLARRLGASRMGSMLAVVVGAAVFIMKGLGHFEPATRTGAWMPWLFLSAAGLVAERRAVYLVLFISSNLLMYLGGHVELIGLCYELIAVVLLAAGIYYRRQWRRVLGSYLLFSAAFAAGFLISQAQALPTMELTGFSIRSEGLTFQYFKIWSMAVLNLTAWIPYVTTGMVMACLAAAVAGARRSPVLLFGVAAMAFCVCLIHDLFGVMWVLYHLPVLKGLLAHARILYVAELILPLMIGMGAERAVKRVAWVRAMAVLSVLTGVFWLVFLLVFGDRLSGLGGAETGGLNRDIIRALSVALPLQALIWAPLLFGRARARVPRYAGWAIMLTALLAYGAPLIYVMPRNPVEPFGFPADYVRFVEEHQGLHRTQTVYGWDGWEHVRIPLQTGIIHGTRSADGFITVSVDRYTRFLNALVPGTFREDGGRIGDLQATKVIKEGLIVTDSNIPWIDFLGIKYLAAEQRNLKFSSSYFLAFPDSAFAAEGGEAAVRRDLRTGDDILGFSGRASARLYLQEGDRLGFTARTRGFTSWLLAIAREEQGRGDSLVFARFLEKDGLEFTGIPLSERPKVAEFFLAAVPGKGGRAGMELINPQVTNPHKYFQRVLAGKGYSVFENPGAMPLAFMLARWKRAEKADVLDVLTSPGFDPRSMAVVEGPVAETYGGPARAPDELASVERYSPDLIEISTSSGFSRLLVLTDAYYPGWTAEVNGKEQRILPVDYAFRGVFLGAGKNRVRMEYRPASFRLGLWLSVSSLGCLVVFVLWGLKAGHYRSFYKLGS